MADESDAHRDVEDVPSQGGSGMHIHQPKPASSVREFLSEIAVIAVGIAIALSGEQVLEALHWRHQTEAAEVALHHEISDDLTNAEERLMLAQCAEERIKTLSDALRGPAGPWRGDAIEPGEVNHAVLPQVYAMRYRPWLRGAWDTAAVSNTVDHFPRDRLAFYVNAYRLIDALQDVQNRELDVRSQLQPLAYDQDLDRSQRLAFEKDLAELDNWSRLGMLASQSLIENIKRSDVRSQIRPDNSFLAEQLLTFRRELGACARPPDATLD